MPRRADIASVMVIGSGPIIIGQACEFDYSGTQACRILRAEGLRVVLVNSNPATIMTDPEFADATYVEPLTTEVLTAIIARERPDALLPTLGGQTALNAAVALARAGVLDQYGVELIGADIDVIEAGENRERFREVVRRIGANSARSEVCHTLAECEAAAGRLGYPLVVRPSFTMGGAGSGIARDQHSLARIVAAGLAASPTSEVLLEESVLGWKEFELEVMRDCRDNAIVVCSIENVDPMGVHTGDSITVAPALTLTDREYQHMRDVGIAVVREVGVDTGGCNIQFAINPQDGRMVVIEMNPRVSRSSALASKATGFPIAKIAARLAIGYTLDEITNDITGTTPASFEPALDYIVVKVPRFAFEKFTDADPVLTTHMKSVGEAMAIGRCFTEALLKAMESLEKPEVALDLRTRVADPQQYASSVATPTEFRLRDLVIALHSGMSVEQAHRLSGIDPWFCDQLLLVTEVADLVQAAPQLDRELLLLAKRHGLSDRIIADLRGVSEPEVRAVRWAFDVHPVYKTVDTCAAEFPALTPYHYSCYDEEDEADPTDSAKVVILGSGPNRIGQGIEFDYSCVHAASELRRLGIESIMINCNPETVSTDYDTSDRLYFEPLTVESVLEVLRVESRAGRLLGVITQLGGQTPLRLAAPLAQAGVTILGTSPAAIHLAEERGAFGGLLADAGIPAPAHGVARTAAEAAVVAERIGYPVLVRPSFVLGGRGMEIVADPTSLVAFVERATQVSPEHPVLIDRFLDGAREIDVDALYDGSSLVLGGIMEHIEEAGVHSGDSACVLPPVSLTRIERDRIREVMTVIAERVGVRGLINVQFALHEGTLYVLEANPRASRTVPFVAKVTGIPLARAAVRIMLGHTIADMRGDLLPATGDGDTVSLGGAVAVKEAVLPFGRFHGVDTLLGPEMRATGEVMGLADSFGRAFAKAQQGVSAAGLPTGGRAIVAMADGDVELAGSLIGQLGALGFTVLATPGTADRLRALGIPVTDVDRGPATGGGQSASAGAPSIVMEILAGRVDLVINTRGAAGGLAEGYEIRTAAVQAGIPSITTIAGLRAAVAGIASLQREPLTVRSLQEHGRSRHASAATP